MNSEKYIGLEVHQATISVAVLDATGKLVIESILETKAATILEFFAGLRGTLSVTFEEGTWAAWLYDVLHPHVANLIVCNPRKNALVKDGNKSVPYRRPQAGGTVVPEQAQLGLPRRDGRAPAARTGPELSDHCQRSDPSHEPVESGLSQLGDPLCRAGRLLYPSSSRVAGKDQGSRCPSPRRTALPATGHAAALAPASTPRTIGGESKTSHHRQVTAGSLTRAHSLRSGGGADPDSA